MLSAFLAPICHPLLFSRLFQLLFILIQVSCLGYPDSVHASGEGERVIAPEPWEGTLASRRVEEGLSRSFSG